MNTRKKVFVMAAMVAASSAFMSINPDSAQAQSQMAYEQTVTYEMDGGSSSNTAFQTPNYLDVSVKSGIAPAGTLKGAKFTAPMDNRIDGSFFFIKNGPDARNGGVATAMKMSPGELDKMLANNMNALENQGAALNSISAASSVKTGAAILNEVAVRKKVISPMEYHQNKKAIGFVPMKVAGIGMER